MIRLATGITPNYLARATPYLRSLAANSNIEPTIFGVDFPSSSLANFIPVDYSRVMPKMPKWMLQAGEFVNWVPGDWNDDDVVIFTDADAILQRPFFNQELAGFNSLRHGEVAAGYNWPNEPENLLQEAKNLFPKTKMENIIQLFPKLADYECRNCGFLVARLSTWRELYKLTTALVMGCQSCFDNPAWVQLCICYAIQDSGLKFAILWPSTHAHGHCSLKHGLVKRDDGLWYQDGECVAFAHAL